MRVPAALIKPLRSRKVRASLVTVIVAYLAEAGLNVPNEIVMTILGVGVAYILGTAHEDHGKHAAAAAQPPSGESAGEARPTGK